MAQHNQDWDDLGRSIQDIVDRAVNSKDFQKMNQTITQVVEKAVNVGTEAVRKAMDTPKPESAPKPRDLSLLYGKTSGRTLSGILKTVGGGLLTCVSALAFFAYLIIDLFIEGLGITVWPVVGSLIFLGLGGGLIWSGARSLGQVKRFKAYRKTLGQKTHCALAELSRAVGKSVKFVRRELQQMIDQGLFLEGHLDKEGASLITSHETYRHYENSLLQLQERQRKAAQEQKANPAQDPRVREVLDKGNAFIAEIRRCNDAIPGEEISAKIDRMEGIVRRIFQRAEAHPEIVPDLKKMMDYYLPMTVKLLNAYADMDAQPIRGETIENSKREIEATLDTLNRAFEKLLDDLYQDTAMDVSSDISVLNTLLAQEGLTEDELSKMRKNKQ